MVVPNYAEKTKALAIRLFEIEAFKFGEFTLKSGIKSPVYFDLRVIISYPDVMDQLNDLIDEYTANLQLTYQQLCGVPYTALPIATLLSVRQHKPMLIRRKEAKGYGTKKLIEGRYAAGDICLIVEDVITTGSSILETVRDLRAEQMAVHDAIVVVDREQGAVANIGREQVRVHSLFSLSQLLQLLQEAGKIDASTVEAVRQFVAASQTAATEAPTPSKPAAAADRLRLRFEERAQLARNPVARRLLQLMAAKRTTLCVAADVTSCAQLLDLAAAIGPHICVLKTHVDVLRDYTPATAAALQALATQHQFVLLEDRKFADIGNTVALQYSQGLYAIAGWADLVTVHSLPGAGILRGLQSVVPAGAERGAFLLAELSCAGNLCGSAGYVEETVRLAEGSDFVAGVVCQTKGVVREAGLVQLTPGVKIGETGDELGQQYDTPERAVLERGADVAVVGRGVYGAKDAAGAAKLYREQLWAAYEKRVAV